MDFIHSVGGWMNEQMNEFYFGYEINTVSHAYTNLSLHSLEFHRIQIQIYDQHLPLHSQWS